MERLYAPLDIEDYGDLDDEAQDDLDRWPMQRPTAPRSSLKQGHGTTLGGGKKKARFDSNIWDDSVEIDSLPARTKSSAAASSDPPSEAASSSTAAPAKRREDLFSIDDDEDDDGEAVTGKANANGALADGPNVWKQVNS